MDREIYIPTVRRAAELAGGYDALAKQVGVTSNDVLRWLDGTLTPSAEALLHVLDVVILKKSSVEIGSTGNF